MPHSEIGFAKLQQPGDSLWQRWIFSAALQFYDLPPPPLFYTLSLSPLVCEQLLKSIVYPIAVKSTQVTGFSSSKGVCYSVVQLHRVPSLYRLDALKIITSLCKELKIRFNFKRSGSKSLFIYFLRHDTTNIVTAPHWSEHSQHYVTVYIFSAFH